MASSAQTLALEALERWRSHDRFADKIVQELLGKLIFPEKIAHSLSIFFTTCCEILLCLISGLIGFAPVHSMQIRATACALA